MATKPPFRPTVMGEVRAKPPNSAPQLGPTLMPGHTPERFEPDLSDLTRDAGLAEAASGILRGLIPDHITPRLALSWGQALQETHRDQMADRLALSRAPVLQETTAHLARLRAILSRIDPEALSAPSLATRMLAPLTRLIDTPAELTAARAEIEMLLRFLSQAQVGLHAHREALETHAASLHDLGSQIEAMALAARWLAAHAPQARSFEDRAESLRATLIQIRSAELQLTAEVELPSRLILAVQNIALVALPAWLEQLSRLGPRPSPTETRALAFRLHDLFPLFPKE